MPQQDSSRQLDDSGKIPNGKLQYSDPQSRQDDLDTDFANTISRLEECLQKENNPAKQKSANSPLEPTLMLDDLDLGLSRNEDRTASSRLEEIALGNNPNIEPDQPQANVSLLDCEYRWFNSAVFAKLNYGRVTQSLKVNLATRNGTVFQEDTGAQYAAVA